VEDEPRGAASEPHTEQSADSKPESATRPESRPGRSHRSFLPDVTDVNFSIARRGYDRTQVERYVERVSRVVVELEASRSPDAVIERALADVGEETSAILRRARAAAEEIVEKAESEASQLRARAESDAAQRVADAESEATERLTRADADARRTREAADSFSDKVHREAEEALAQARADARNITAGAEGDAERTREEADRYHRQVIGHTEQLAQQRRRLIEDLRELGDSFHHTADRALEEVPEPPRRPAEPARGPAEGEGESAAANA
jgi:cell division septum initiation protein DivIVA